MISLDQLKKACREHDTAAETIPLPQIVESMGLSIGDLAHVADQRALRLILIQDHGEVPPDMTIIQFDDERKERLINYTVACIDGIMIGLRAAKSQKENPCS